MVDPETREADFNSEVTFQCLSVGEFLSSVIVIAISVLESLFKVLLSVWIAKLLILLQFTIPQDEEYENLSVSWNAPRMTENVIIEVKTYDAFFHTLYVTKAFQ